MRFGSGKWMLRAFMAALSIAFVGGANAQSPCQGTLPHRMVGPSPSSFEKCSVAYLECYRRSYADRPAQSMDKEMRDREILQCVKDAERRAPSATTAARPQGPEAPSASEARTQVAPSTPLPAPSAAAPPPSAPSTAKAEPTVAPTPAQNSASVAGGASASSASSADLIELAFWESIRTSTSQADFRAYLETFPNGRFASLARLRANPPPAAASRPIAPAFDFGTYHALVIGNDAYRNLPRLQTAANDARSLAKLLTDTYGFKVKVLLNATRYEMLSAMTSLRQSLTERDNLLIFYAGHGYLDADTERGYWMPIDADRENPANWVSNGDLTDMVKAIRARHVLVVADSCYSGTLTRSIAPDFRNPQDQEKWWLRVVNKRSRAALTSGGLEPVLDGGGQGHSVFALAMLRALQENDSVLDATGLFKRIQRPVVVNSDQTPAYSDIRGAGHDGGEFLFVRQR